MLAKRVFSILVTMRLQQQQNNFWLILAFFTVKINLNIFVGDQALCQKPPYVATPTRARLECQKYVIKYYS